jgi:hypothetical protein
MFRAMRCVQCSMTNGFPIRLEHSGLVFKKGLVLATLRRWRSHPFYFAKSTRFHIKNTDLADGNSGLHAKLASARAFESQSRRV